jgi:uncharacterized protein YqgV (UPF0045/DUF77 family)
MDQFQTELLRGIGLDQEMNAAKTLLEGLDLNRVQRLWPRVGVHRLGGSQVSHTIRTQNKRQSPKTAYKLLILW